MPCRPAPEFPSLPKDRAGSTIELMSDGPGRECRRKCVIRCAHRGCGPLSFPIPRGESRNPSAMCRLISALDRNCSFQKLASCPDVPQRLDAGLGANLVSECEAVGHRPGSGLGSDWESGDDVHLVLSLGGHRVWATWIEPRPQVTACSNHETGRVDPTGTRLGRRKQT